MTEPTGAVKLETVSFLDVHGNPFIALNVVGDPIDGVCVLVNSPAGGCDTWVIVRSFTGAFMHSRGEQLYNALRDSRAEVAITNYGYEYNPAELDEQEVPSRDAN